MQLVDSSVDLLHLLCSSAHTPMLHILFLSFGDRPVKQSVVTDPQVTGQGNGSPLPIDFLGGEGMAEKQADNLDAGDGTSNVDADAAEEILFGEEEIRYD